MNPLGSTDPKYSTTACRATVRMAVAPPTLAPAANADIDRNSGRKATPANTAGRVSTTKFTPSASGPPCDSRRVCRVSPTATASGARHRRMTPTSPFSSRCTDATPSGRWTDEATKKAAVSTPTRGTSRSFTRHRLSSTASPPSTNPPASHAGWRMPELMWTANGGMDGVW
jgi:hypothetical protein